MSPITIHQTISSQNTSDFNYAHDFVAMIRREQKNDDDSDDDDDDNDDNNITMTMIMMMVMMRRGIIKI